jgi:hypothetical protein
LAPGYSSGSVPSRCRPSEATTFQRVFEAHHSDSPPPTSNALPCGRFATLAAPFHVGRDVHLIYTRA